MFVGSSGLHWKGHSSTYSISGRISEKALTKRDLPEPLGPDIKTPPIVGFIAFRIKDVFTFSCPTMAVKG
jgi:hypothetical protein